MISEVLWHSPDSNFTENTSDIYHWNEFEIYQFETVFKSPMDQWVNEIMGTIDVLYLAKCTARYSVIQSLGPGLFHCRDKTQKEILGQRCQTMSTFPSVSTNTRQKKYFKLMEKVTTSRTDLWRNCNRVWHNGVIVSLVTITSVMVNSLRPSDAIWRQRTGSTLAQVMACCLTAPSHHLNQCWLIVSKALWQSTEGYFKSDTPSINW